MCTFNSIASFTSHAAAQHKHQRHCGRAGATRKMETNTRNVTKTVELSTSFPSDQSTFAESREHAHVARYEKTSFCRD